MPKKKKKKRKMKSCPNCKEGVCKLCKGKGVVKIINGRAKGGLFERKIAGDLTEWTGVKFTRVPLSGGWNQTGDVTPKDPKEMVKFPFNIECKNQEIFNPGVLFKKKTELGLIPPPISKWWSQCFQDSIKAKNIPVLVFTKANEQIFVMVSGQDFGAAEFFDELSVYEIRNDFVIFLWEDLMQMDYERVKWWTNRQS